MVVGARKFKEPSALQTQVNHFMSIETTVVLFSSDSINRGVFDPKDRDVTY